LPERVKKKSGIEKSGEFRVFRKIEVYFPKY